MHLRQGTSSALFGGIATPPNSATAPHRCVFVCVCARFCVRVCARAHLCVSLPPSLPPSVVSMSTTGLPHHAGQCRVAV